MSNEATCQTPKTTALTKRRSTVRDPSYPRKRSLKACHVCRSRKTKCDNVLPKCGFCASLNISCTYDDIGEKDHSSFDAATREILRQLGKLSKSQDDILQLIQRAPFSSDFAPSSSLLPFNQADQINHLNQHERDESQFCRERQEEERHESAVQSNSPVSSPSLPRDVAARKWLGVLTTDASHAIQPDFSTPNPDAAFLRTLDLEGEAELTPLQRATRNLDSQSFDGHGISPVSASIAGLSTPSTRTAWHTTAPISLLSNEQALFENFLHYLSSWFEVFDANRTFSAKVPHMALRNAGLMNAILALSSYHMSLDSDRSELFPKSSAVQYYYQTLHYVQKAMQYSSYWNSTELIATTIIVSTYEMLHGSSNDWQRHLQGVFWILRSRQIEVERMSLESTVWWAWLQQDIWAAFREKRRTYSTWTPKKACRELGTHELAARALWILAQVVNFCALDTRDDDLSALVERIAWSRQLKDMLREWSECLTDEFSPLPVLGEQGSQPFKPRLIFPSCYGLATQAHHASTLLLLAHAPCVGGLQTFLERQRAIQESVGTICGIGMAMNDHASTVSSSQYVFIAGIFVLDPQQRQSILQMLDSFHKRCRWPLASLSRDLQETYNRASPI